MDKFANVIFGNILVGVHLLGMLIMCVVSSYMAMKWLDRIHRATSILTLFGVFCSILVT